MCSVFVSTVARLGLSTAPKSAPTMALTMISTIAPTMTPACAEGANGKYAPTMSPTSEKSSGNLSGFMMRFTWSVTMSVWAPVWPTPFGHRNLARNTSIGFHMCPSQVVHLDPVFERAQQQGPGEIGRQAHSRVMVPLSLGLQENFGSLLSSGPCPHSPTTSYKVSKSCSAPHTDILGTF